MKETLKTSIRDVVDQWQMGLDSTEAMSKIETIIYATNKVTAGRDDDPDHRTV